MNAAVKFGMFAHAAAASVKFLLYGTLSIVELLALGVAEAAFVGFLLGRGLA